MGTEDQLLQTFGEQGLKNLKAHAKSLKVSLATFVFMANFEPSNLARLMQSAMVERERVIDKRLEFLYQRREAARKAYMEPDWDDRKEWERTREEYHTAIEAYSISAERYGREAPSMRELRKRYEPISS